MGRSGNPVVSAIVSSARFAGRRAASGFMREPAIETLIVDVDRTLTREDSPKLAMEALCGKEEAHRVFGEVLRSAMLGRIPLAGIHSAIFGELYKKGFRRSDWAPLMEAEERSGGIRLELIGAIISVCSARSITPVLATRSSRDTAEWLARRFGFPFALGSEERSINGAFLGFSSMIGVEDGTLSGIPILTKLSAASRLLSASGSRLDPAATAVLTNDLLDAFEMLDSQKGLLLVPKKPNTLERLTLGFKLYDEKIHEGGDFHSQLSRALGVRE